MHRFFFSLKNRRTKALDLMAFRFGSIKVSEKKLSKIACGKKSRELKNFLIDVPV
jgi:hypothetical protein